MHQVKRPRKINTRRPRISGGQSSVEIQGFIYLCDGVHINEWRSAFT